MNAQFALATDLNDVFDTVNFEFSRRRFAMIVRAVQRAAHYPTPAEIVDFINGGEDGWNLPVEAQQDWYDSNSVAEIASWIVSGLN